jgi:hypothetical protein
MQTNICCKLTNAQEPAAEHVREAKLFSILKFIVK